MTLHDPVLSSIKVGPFGKGYTKKIVFCIPMQTF